MINPYTSPQDLCQNQTQKSPEPHSSTSHGHEGEQQVSEGYRGKISLKAIEQFRELDEEIIRLHDRVQNLQSFRNQAMLDLFSFGCPSLDLTRTLEKITDDDLQLIPEQIRKWTKS